MGTLNRSHARWPFPCQNTSFTKSLKIPRNRAYSHRRQVLTVYAAKGRSGGNAGGKSKSKNGSSWSAPPKPQSTGKPKMSSLAGQEILLFDPVAPSRDALKVCFYKNKIPSSRKKYYFKLHPCLEYYAFLNPFPLFRFPGSLRLP